MSDYDELLAKLDHRGEYGGPGPYGATTGYPDNLIKDAATAIRQLKGHYQSKVWGADPEMLIPIPQMAPFGSELSISAVREVWNTYIKPNQDAGNLQSIEERELMAILRAVYAGFNNIGQEEEPNE